ncbi:MAG TPA: ergothioneine biosynthesis protein EgtB [Gemmatimonadales bacterium]|nr:ergothioneine biosynthesis protein EgtB [Gemmatimonadales bacterium]
MTLATAPSRIDRETIAARLLEARARTLLLVTPLGDDDLHRQHDPLMSPILWDLGHIAHFEELWLTRNLDGPVEFVEMPGLYNPFEHPRSTRASLQLPDLAGCRGIMDEIRSRVLARLDGADLDASSPLLRDGFVYQMVLQHEYQHGETMLQTLQLKRGAPYTPLVRLEPGDGGVPALGRAGSSEMVRFPGGAVPIGTDDRSAAYDNERPAHVATVAPFWIDVHPVTNGDFLAFMNAGGYDRPEHWSEAGWKWRTETSAVAPKYWERRDDVWTARSMDRSGRVDPRHPVCHVSWYEADAFARFAGKRLPTEIEWEAAASWEPATGSRRTYPWGETPPDHTFANVDQLVFGTAPIGSYAANISPIGCSGMIGDVWEWTASDFGPWPGFESFPYREYSEVFFGTEYKVLRGGSWATRPGAVRNTFRNWDYPVRRQIFSGFRCARDD